MPPIPVHLDDPIVAQKPDGATPQTEPPPTQTSPDAPTTTTAAAATTTSQAYPPARPGAAAAPAPTSYIPHPQPQPTRTTQTLQDGPPPPQPGAVPVPGMQQVTASTLPPPPKAGETAKAREAGAEVTQMPHQMGYSPPETNYAPTHSTATTVNLGPVAPAAPTGVPTAPYQPPEGYRQDTNAQEMSAAQRSHLEEQQRRESLFANVNLGGAGRSGTGNGGSAGEGVTAQVGETAANAWTAVKGVLGSAGEKLAEVEGDVWRRIQGGK